MEILLILGLIGLAVGIVLWVTVRPDIGQVLTVLGVVLIIIWAILGALGSGAQVGSETLSGAV